MELHTPVIICLKVFKKSNNNILVSKSDADRTLAVYIREVALLRGTKIVCEEGGCGACTVTVKTAADAAPISVNSVC